MLRFLGLGRRARTRTTPDVASESQTQDQVRRELAAAQERLQALQAIEDCQAVIQFTPDGVIRKANSIMRRRSATQHRN